MHAELRSEEPPWRPAPRPIPPDIPRVPPWRPDPPAPRPQPPLPAPEPPRFPFVPFPAERTRPDVWTKLLDRRIVMLSGQLDEAAATRAAAEVMLLDADGAGSIQLHLSCPDGDLGAAVMLAETVDLLQAPVHAFAGGLVGGPVVAVYASAGRRLAHRHAAFQLHEPKVRMEGNADELAAHIAQHQHQLDYVHEHIADRCGREPDDVAADMRAGRLLTATAAIDYGLVHELTGRTPG